MRIGTIGKTSARGLTHWQTSSKIHYEITTYLCQSCGCLGHTLYYCIKPGNMDLGTSTNSTENKKEKKEEEKEKGKKIQKRKRKGR